MFFAISCRDRWHGGNTRCHSGLFAVPLCQGSLMMHHAEASKLGRTKEKNTFSPGPHCWASCWCAVHQSREPTQHLGETLARLPCWGGKLLESPHPNSSKEGWVVWKNKKRCSPSLLALFLSSEKDVRRTQRRVSFLKSKRLCLFCSTAIISQVHPTKLWLWVPQAEMCVQLG